MIDGEDETYFRLII